ncbi:snare associated Golgi protein-domain-containing protein [Radiomyces spectabilis]|uniref:snare associated Golgi protein-domain-containing protein n=1 Tax=Radiomyces spectabilis TaxID=64574 RepID=UPI00221F1D4E|nr:snare associated Golgi protein-domain-containing protein [Radiomyces spectabilis]KAI8384349.1 snare associated Golgi protein-domain-containing protein [Radiomyces spectabilis]
MDDDDVQFNDRGRTRLEPMTVRDDDPLWSHGTSRRQAMTQRINRLVHLLQDRQRLSMLAHKYRWLLAAGVFSFVMGLFMYAYRRELLEALENLSAAVKSMGAGGYCLIGTLIFLSAFPPMIGYSTFQTLSGFTFGFQYGFPLSYFSALCGAVGCFMLSRHLLKERVQRWMKKHNNLEAVVRAVEKKGFKLFLLIRLSPYPFGLLNVLFAAIDISLYHFALGTALSLTKIALHVYIGANLTSFAKRVLGEEDEMTDEEKHLETVRYIIVIIGSLLAFVIMIYVYTIAKRAVDEANHLDNDESVAFLGPDADDEEWIEWNDDEEEDEDTDRDSDGGNDKHATRGFSK